MRAEADEFVEDLASRSIVGFWEPLLKLGFFVRLALRLKNLMITRRPAALVCIDYYGFNRRLLTAAKSAGIPAYYFISPQVWASRPGRIQVLKRLVRKMLVIFPFEERLYRAAGVPCVFVGHPLLDLVPEPDSRPPCAPPFTVGLLPGSRRTEVRRHLPVLLEAFGLIAARYPGSRALLFASPHMPDSAYAAADGRAEIVRETGYNKRAGLDVALSSSGTATLENALLGVPMVVIYKMSWLTFAIARSLIRVPHIAMANLLAGRRLMPELVQHEATGALVARAALDMVADPSRHAALRRDLLDLRRQLGAPGAATLAAREITREIGIIR
jgi:lipid-A-disaccharide synthase